MKKKKKYSHLISSIKGDRVVLEDMQLFSQTHLK